jgi:citrate synthase
MERSEFNPSISLSHGRLAVISSHISALTGGRAGLAQLERSPVLARDLVAPGRNLGGSITVVDGRTGKKYEIKVSDEGTIRTTDFKKVSY